MTNVCFDSFTSAGKNVAATEGTAEGTAEGTRAGGTARLGGGTAMHCAHAGGRPAGQRFPSRDGGNRKKQRLKIPKS